MFRFGLMISLVICLMMAAHHVANAQQDITPPALLDVRFEPGHIDTSKGPVTITVTIHVTDDLSGVDHVALFFRKPGTTQQNQVEFRPQDSWGKVIEGDELDGWYQNTMTLPQYAAYGEWEMHYFMTMDNVGNRIDIRKPDDVAESDGWLSLYNGFVFAVGNEVQQPQRQIYLPSLSTQ